MSMRKSEHTKYRGVILFAASPKFGCTPLGGDMAGVLDNCLGVSSVKIDDMIDFWFIVHTVRITDAGCNGSELEPFVLLSSRR